MKRTGAVVASAVLVVVLGSCNAYVPHLRTIRANYNVSRGDYQPAIVDYLRAQEDGFFQHWIAYNLGNIYHFLGESNAALERWDFARNSNDQELLFRASFNRGVFFFEQGRYREAFQQFRLALELQPGHIAAKRNMEMTLERLFAETELTGPAGGQSSTPGGSTPGAPGEDLLDSGTANRMLDYMRRREEQRWRANVEETVDPLTQDW